MDAETRKQVQIILRRLCVGRSVCGIHFYASQPVLVLSSFDGSNRSFKGPDEAYLVIESGWILLDPGELASDPPERPSQPLEDLARLACSLRISPIVAAEIDNAAHLTLRFNDGRALIVSGYHPHFETWSINAEDWSIYVLPGGKITWGEDHPALT